MKLLLSMLGVMLSLSAHANDAAFKKPRSTTISIGKGCDFRLLVPKNAEMTSRYESAEFGKGGAGLMLENPWSLTSKNYIAPFYFNFNCYPADSGVVTQGWTTYDQSDNKWHISLSPRDAKMYTNAHATYQLTSVNALGWAVTINDVTGDERYRQRHLHYCLIRGSKALCGNGDMGYLQDGKKKDLTPYTLQILRSIEFIDDTPAPESAPASLQDTTTAPP